MGKHRTVFVFLALGAIAGLVLAACGPTPTPTTPPTKPPAATPTPVPPTATPAPIKITFQEPWKLDSDRGKVIKGIVDGFMKKNPNITVEIVDTMPEKAKVVSQILAGKASNVMMMPEDWVAEFGPQNAFLDLSPYVAKWPADKKGDFYAPVFKLAQSPDGKVQYGVNWIAHSMALIYNKGMFKAAGLDPNKPPKTWDELYDYAKKLTTPDGKQFGWGLVGKQGHDQAWMIYTFMWQNGGKLISDDGTKVLINSPENLEALKFYLKLKAVAPPEAASSGGGELGTQFQSKRTAMWLMGPWAVADALTKAPDIDVGTAILPYKKNPATTIGSGILVVPATEKTPEAAWKLIDYLTDTEPQMEILIPAAKFVFRLPVRKSLLAHKWFDENPLYKPFVQSLEYGNVPFPHAKWGDIHNNVVQPEFSKAYTGSITPEAALANIERLGNELLKK
ncbi:MAG: ABC transporter substrate-binding protein [Chloroflexi bacterium]|nr:ABC transporter substrate-binding protein [Chloroflexota bacterium]